MVVTRSAKGDDHSRIRDAIRQSFAEVCEHPPVFSWKRNERLMPGDVVVVNNSFVFRSKVTTTNEHHIIE